MAVSHKYSITFKGRTVFADYIKDARAKAYRLVDADGGIAYIKKRDNDDGNYRGREIVVKNPRYTQIYMGYGNGTNAHISHRVDIEGNAKAIPVQYNYMRSYPLLTNIIDGKFVYHRR